MTDRLEAALDLTQRGMAIVLCEGKSPDVSGKGWQNRRWTEQDIKREFDRHPSRTLGLIMGPRSGVIDLECDSPEAEKTLLDLFDGEVPVTPTWKSKRGKHRLHQYAARLDVIGKGHFNIGKLDVKLGCGGKGTQCIAPPSTVEGVAREWLPGLGLDDVDAAELPELVIDKLILHGCNETNGDVSRADAVSGGVAEGERNDAAAAWIGRLLAKGANLDDPKHWQDTVEWNEKNEPPLLEPELRQTFQSILGRERARRRTPPTDRLSIRSAEGRTDIANGRRFAQLHGRNVRYCHPWKRWLVWDGRRFKRDDTGAVFRLAKRVADKLWAEARQTDEKPPLVFAAKTANDKHVKAMLNQAASEPGIPVLPAQLDQNHWLLNCPNGTVALRTGTVRSHDRTDLITALCPTPFNPEAGSYHFDQFLESIFLTNDLIQLVGRWFGYCLTGDVREQVLPIFWGKGAKGKSTLLNLFRDAVGHDYTMQAKPDLLLTTKYETHATERMDLFEKRFVSCTETEEGRRLNESFAKTLVGGEPIRCRRCYENSWQFDPTHKVVLCTNHRPKIKGTDHAIWRRLRLVPFTVKFWSPDENETGPLELKQDKELPDRLREEYEGLLAWAVRGCVEWQAHGLGRPASVADATADYRNDEDIVGRFIADCCVAGPAVTVIFGQLYSAIEVWCEDVGEDVPSKKFVGRYLQHQAYTKVKGRPVAYQGAGLKAKGATR